MKERSPDWQTAPRNTSVPKQLGPVFLCCLFLLDGNRVSVDKNRLLSCWDLGRDNVIPPTTTTTTAHPPRPAVLAGLEEKEQRRRGVGIDFQSEGMRRIELRCGAETGFERNILLAGGAGGCVCVGWGSGGGAAEGLCNLNLSKPR